MYSLAKSNCAVTWKVLAPLLQHSCAKSLSRSAFSRCFSDSEKRIPNARTDITSQLWKIRQEQTRKLSEEPGELLTCKFPSHSHLSIDLPFRSDAQFRDEYRGFDGAVRFGRVLEDLDAFAGNIAFKHANENTHAPPLVLVTACVDRIDILRPFLLTEDLCMRGQVNYVGRSSMEITVDVTPSTITTLGHPSRILTAVFLFVARTPCGTKGAPVLPLVPENDDDKIGFARGQENKQRRIDQAESALHLAPPTGEESKLIHSIFSNNRALRERARKGKDAALELEMLTVAQAKRGTVLYMDHEDTMKVSSTITQPQERNTNDRVFGGYLMRMAFEVSSANAHVFCGPPFRPTLLAVDDMTFNTPVEIGSVVEFKSNVVYSEGSPSKLFQIATSTRVTCVKTGKQHISNRFYFTFGVFPRKEASPAGLRVVHPHSYLQAMAWLDGRRRLHECIREGQQQDSELLALCMV